MLPRSLTKRIFLAFALLSVAVLVAAAATLFVVLRNAHQDSLKQSLGYEVVAVEASLVANPPVDQAALELRVRSQPLVQQMVDDGGFVLAQGPRGAIRIVAGNPSSSVFPEAPSGVKNYIDTLRTSDGRQYVFIEPDPNAFNRIRFLLAVPDTSAQMAASDLFRTFWVIVLTLLLVGLPSAWLLSRSVTRPMRRLADAARDLPRSTEEQQLPLRGPTEVRVLTERFNEMAHELVSTRHEESQMLANLRHDLRTPLTSIGGFAEAIADGTATGPAATSAAKTIAEEAQRLERLVGELGVVERLREGPASLRPEALDADELLAGAAARFEGRAAAAGVRLDVAGRAPGTPPLAFTGDRLAVERILQNLVDNSLSFLPNGGTVWLRAARLTMPGRAPGISMSVTDDGPGFPPATAEKVFERFYRADPSRSGSGSGLGLAIVREMARAHGGEAWAENIAPHGARVTVLLPIVPAIPKAAAPADPLGAGTGPAAGA
jgi:signal transduction histidine kinase